MPSPFFLCVSFILNEQQASKMMASSGVSLGHVEPAYWVLLSPMLLQEMNALYWSCLSPHCFAGPGLCGTVCTPAHTAAIISPATSFMQLWTLVPKPVSLQWNLLRKGLWTTYQVRALLRYGNVQGSPTFLLPLGQEKQANRGPLWCVYLWAIQNWDCGVTIPNLYMESPFTTFWPRAGNSEAPCRGWLSPTATESGNYKVLCPQSQQRPGVSNLII